MNLLRPFTLAAEGDPARKSKHTVTLFGSAAVTSVTEKSILFSSSFTDIRDIFLEREKEAFSAMKRFSSFLFLMYIAYTARIHSETPFISLFPLPGQFDIHPDLYLCSSCV